MKKMTNMISSKDLAYISDIFNWNITAAKKIDYYLNLCDDEDLCKELNKIYKLHLKNCEKLIFLLEDGDINE